MKKILAFLLVLAFSFATFACAEAPAGGFGGAYKDGMSADGSLSDGSLDSEESGESADKVDDESNEQEIVRLPAGMITAGAWNDNDNYKMWISLFNQGNAEEEIQDGKFYSYTVRGNLWGFNSLNRVKVNVTSAGAPVSGATVVAYSTDGNALFSAVSDAQGNAYLFVNEVDGTVAVTSGEGSTKADFTSENRELSIELDSHAEKLNVIEIMFVVDVTGSMGDEIKFLKAELADVIDRIAKNDSQTVIKLAFIFYRDVDDKVPFDEYEFLDVTNADGMHQRQEDLEKQQASGGGDYEEAVDEALERAVNAQWSTGATTKLIFHVLDAPAHSGSEYEDKFNAAVIKAAEKGIRICPILCSGAAEITEYTMRQAAIYTGGTFIFVTDDSGIGNSHYDPNIPNITIELLNSMLVRLVKGYHTGEFENPIYWREDPALATEK